MPPKKKRKQAAPKKLTPEEHRAKCREAAVQKLKAHARSLRLDEEDLDRLSDSVRALIEMNQEIWGRCKQSKVDVKYTEEITFYRIGYFSVQVTTPISDGQLIFTTSSELMTNDFPGLPSIPSILLDFVSVLPPTDAVFPDYEAFFGKAILLNDEILAPFLAIVKEHLKSVQVYLGKIESWLLEPSHAISFINEQFGLELNLPEITGCNDSCTVHHKYSAGEVCIKCFKPRSRHNSVQSSSSYSRSISKHRFCSLVASSGNTSNSAALASHNRASYWSGIRSEPQELKHVDIKEGEITKAFQICNGADQKHLKKFVEFVDSFA